MAEAAVFQATVHGFRTVPTRKVVQVTIEAPIEEHARIAEIARHGAWVAVARLEAGSFSGRTPDFESGNAGSNPAPAAKTYSLPQRVAMICNEPVFWRFIESTSKRGLGNIERDCPDSFHAASFVREYCGVESRKEILPGTEAAKKWDALHAEYLLWKQS